VLEIQDSKFEHLSAKKPRVSKQGWGNQTRSGMHHLVEEGRKWNANVLAIRSSILAREPNLSHLLQAEEIHGEISERETRWLRRFVSSLKSQTSLTYSKVEGSVFKHLLGSDGVDLGSGSPLPGLALWI
jgi:hypothetical protein